MSDCDMCGKVNCPTPVKCRINLIRADIHDMKWNLRADFWGLLLGCGWRLTKRHPDWAFNNRMMDEKPKVWAAAMLVELER